MASPSIRTSRIALIHAILTAIHPSVSSNAHFPFPVALPSELHLLIRTHLRVHIALSLVESLHSSLTATLSELCDDCKSYYAHVFGPHVADWPVVRAGRGCRCEGIGLPSSLPALKTTRKNDDTNCTEGDLPFRPPVGDREPPAYFLAHVQETLATYASIDPSPGFPYADNHIVSNADLDSFLSRVLSTFDCSLVPIMSSRLWEFDDQVSIVPFPHSPGKCPSVTLEILQLHLDLPIHDMIITRSTLHPTKVTYFPPLPLPIPLVTPDHSSLSLGLAAALVLLAVASPLVCVYALHISAQN